MSSISQVNYFCFYFYFLLNLDLIELTVLFKPYKNGIFKGLFGSHYLMDFEINIEIVNRNETALSLCSKELMVIEFDL